MGASRGLLFAAIVVAGLAGLAGPAAAEVVRFDVVARAAPALGGRTFGDRGRAERITARAVLALDPAEPRNAVIVDLDRAPRNARGRVEAVADVVVLRPARPNGTLLVELPNRGRRLIAGWLEDVNGERGNRLQEAGDAGRGFLLAQGYTLAWVGWQGDAPPGGMGIELPTAVGVTGPSREEWAFPDAASPKRMTLTHPAEDLGGARLAVRRSADAPRETPPGLALRAVDATTVEIDRPADLPAGALYDLAYTARDPRVMGIGLAAIRDVAAFLHRETGPANPLAAEGRSGIDRAIGFGISQSGRALRDFLYFGMNEDERGRLVFEGLMPLIPGARRSFTNDRFAQPSRNPGPRFDRRFPVDQFPFTYAVTDDPLTGRRDGLMARCRLTSTCPRVMQVDSEFEFWGSHGSLLVTDARGRAIDLPDDVRAYLIAGAPHGNPFDAVMRADPACRMPLNPVSGGAAVRALLVAMEAWIRDGTPPPSSRYPQRSQGTLVPPSQVYPAIPGLPYRGQHARAEVVEQAVPWPEARGEYPLFLPRAGLDGNAVAGIRLPLIEAPRATYVGWNAQAAGDGPQDLCTQVGGVVPFAETRAEREAAGDPRPSLEELYPTPDSYVAAARDAADRLVAERLLLPEDAATAVEAARAGTLAKLGR